MEGSEHWTQISEVDRVLEWLKGKSPPPRCVAVMRGNALHRCLNQSDKPNSLCREIHKCLSVLTGGCDNMRKPHTDFCESHRCMGAVGDAPCALGRLSNGAFCTVHSCPCCINDRDCISSKLRIEGNLACIRHRCWGNRLPSDVNLFTCASSPISPHTYCEAHMCVACGLTGSVLNLPRVDGSTLCVAHKCATPKCRSRRRGDFKYCDVHLCWLCETVGDFAEARAVDASVPDSHMCPAHRCACGDCRNPRLWSALDRSFLFCQEHTCRVCFLSGRSCDQPISDDYPRNVCADHPLCTHFALQGWQCGALAVSPNMIKCVKHDVDADMDIGSSVGTGVIMDDGQCCGIAKSTKKRCESAGRSLSGGQYWCDAHRNQAPTVTAPVLALVEEVKETDEYELFVDSCQPWFPLAPVRLDQDTDR